MQSQATPVPTQYSEALDFLWSRINYERTTSVPYTGRSFKLDRMRELLAKLGNPQDGQWIVHIGGTKGKGSTAAMISAVLTASGRRTGTYSSPHLHQLEERIAIDGQPCSADDLGRLAARVRPVVEALDAAGEGLGRATYFEVATAMALLHFVEAQVDATVLEVGLGGRLDSTNVCAPRVSVITNISLDHTKQLGSTHAQIAREKAGIIKPGIPVVSGVLHAEAREVIRQVVAERGAPLWELERDFDYVYRAPQNLAEAAHAASVDFRWLDGGINGGAEQTAYEGLELTMAGRHQAANAALAVATIEVLRRQGWEISLAAIRAGLAAASCPARVEVFRGEPTVVIDAAHNVASIEALIATLDECFAQQRRILIFATTQEKDIRGMLAVLLPAFDAIVLTRYLNNPRYVPPSELSAIAAEFGRHERHAITVVEDPIAAWHYANNLASPADLICVTGSFFIAAEIRQLCRSRFA